MVYDIIVVGSGKGACGFLSYYLNASAHKLITERILVVDCQDVV